MRRTLTDAVDTGAAGATALSVTIQTLFASAISRNTGSGRAICGDIDFVVIKKNNFVLGYRNFVLFRVSSIKNMNDLVCIDETKRRNVVVRAFLAVCCFVFRGGDAGRAKRSSSASGHTSPTLKGRVNDER
jgi:hypothetical protein